MQLKRHAAMAVLTLASLSASAVTYQMGDMTNTGGFSFASEAKTAYFGDRWAFTVTEESYVTFSVVNSFTSIDAGYIQMGAGFGGIGVANVPFAHYTFGPTAHGFATTARGVIGPGSWFLDVNGERPKGGVGFYGGSVSITPVPEPSTYGFLAAGLLTLAAVAKRRLPR